MSSKNSRIPDIFFFYFSKSWEIHYLLVIYVGFHIIWLIHSFINLNLYYQWLYKNQIMSEFSQTFQKGVVPACPLIKQIEPFLFFIQKIEPFLSLSQNQKYYMHLTYLFTYYPGSRNCPARQRALQIILDLADKLSKRNIII